MNGERPAHGRASADALDVEKKFSEEDRHGAFTTKQRRRWSPLTVDGILARSPSTAQAHDLAMAIGKVMRRDGTFLELRDDSDGICVEIRPSHRDKVTETLGISPWSWGEYVRQWTAAGLAHRCRDLRRGSVRLLLEPATVCPVPMCGETLPGATVNRGSEQRSTLPGATENVLTAGDASRDEEGDTSLRRLRDVGGLQDLPQEDPEIAAIGAIKHAGIEIGDPISDEEVRALGYEPTERGWVELKGAARAS